MGPSPGYIHSLNLVRGYAALIVAIHHLSARGGSFSTYPYIAEFCRVSGSDGVAMFFVVSGFVVPYSLYAGRYVLADFWRFIARRIIRIDPPFLVSVLVAIAIWLRFRYTPDGVPLQFDAATVLLHLGYLVDIARYAGVDVAWYVRVYWTLAYEFQFYLFIGLIYAAVVSRSLAVRLAVVALFVAIKAIIFSGIVGELPVFFAKGTFFLLGMLLFQRRTGIIGAREFWIIAIPVWIASCFEYWRFALYAPIIVALVLRYEIKTRLTDFGGRISYSLYLYHDMAGGWFRGALVALLGFGTLGAFLGSLAFAIVLAAVMAWLVEKPALLLSKRISYSRSKPRATSIL